MSNTNYRFLGRYFYALCIDFQTKFYNTQNKGVYGTGSVQASILLSNDRRQVRPSLLSLADLNSNLAVMQYNGWLDFGIQTQREGASGTAYGLFWIPASMDPNHWHVCIRG
jgi:ligand-binding sensor domain-containing protein